MARLTTRVKDTALVAMYLMTAITTKESGKMMYKMVLEVIFTQMVHNTLDIGKEIKKLAREHTNSKLVQFTKETLKKVKVMDLAP